MINLYIIKSTQESRYYIGISKDVASRLNSHNDNRVRSTKNKGPWELVYLEEYDDYKSARLREIKIKSFKGGSAFKRLIEKN